MIPNMYIHEKLLFERHHELQREMEQRRMLIRLRRHRFNFSRHIAGRLGLLLIKAGTSLKRLELNGEQA